MSLSISHKTFCMALKCHRVFFIITLLVVVLCLIGYYWLDRPTAIAMQHLFHFNPRNKSFGQYAAFLLTQGAYSLMLPLFVIYYIFHCRGCRGRLMSCIALVCLSTAFSFFIKTLLQFLLGRIGPRYADSATLLFVRKSQLYGFHWLQAGSFPSGHMSVMCAGLTAICCYYRRAIPIAVLLSFLMAFLLLAMNTHFVSDLIAGMYLGVFIALGLWACCKPMSSGTQRR